MRLMYIPGDPTVLLPVVDGYEGSTNGESFESLRDGMK